MFCALYLSVIIYDYLPACYARNIYVHNLDMDNREFLTTLGVRIKTIRTQKQMTQQELAGLCNFEKSNMSRIEKGKTNPTILTLRIICHALSVRLVDLLDHD